MKTLHVLDEYSVTNPATGKPHIPAWGEDGPDPYCHCGGLWLDDRCSRENTLGGACWSLSAAGWTVLIALAELARVLRPRWTRRRR